MKRTIFEEEHDLFRDAVRRFAKAEIEPKIEGWNAQGISDKATWRAMGQAGFLGPAFPEEYGGGGGDFRYAAIVIEELAYMRAHALQTSLHADICTPYLLHYGTEEQRERFLKPAITGDCLVAIGMTEPGTGSDLASVQTRAIRDGDEYVINGAKTFISNGQNCDLVIVVAKTDPAVKPAHRGISLILVETDRPGFERGRKLDKLGLKGQDTSELFFNDCRVPVSNILGKEGQGFKQLMSQLQQERLVIAVTAIASCRRSLDDTIAYVKSRKAFGKSIAAFQNTQFKLAELATEGEVGPSCGDNAIAAHVAGDVLTTEASLA